MSDDFSNNTFSRAHRWHFDGGTIIDASPSPYIVPLPLSVEAFVDPEEAFIASLSSCHMLTFLTIAAKRKYTVDSYIDNAVGLLDSKEMGKKWVSRVTLYPEVTFSGSHQPSFEQNKKLHQLAHQHCFIANSVLTDIVIKPVF